MINNKGDNFLTGRFSSKSFKWGTLVLLIVSFLFLNLIPSFSENIKNFFYSFSEPFQEWLWEKSLKSSRVVEVVLEMGKIKDENEKLKQRIQELIHKEIKLEELIDENEFLRTALGLELQEDFDLTFAKIIGMDVGRGSLVIDKGSEDGVIFGFPVINQGKCLVGKISEVYEKQSKVQLLTSKESSFDVEVFEKDIYGLAEGQGDFRIILELIPREKEICVGDRIITSALGGNFPQGFLVGEVREVKKSDIKSFQDAEVKPAFDIKDLDYLFIITNFTQ